MARNNTINITNIFPMIPIRLSILDIIKNGISNERGKDSNSGSKESVAVKLVIIFLYSYLSKMK